MDVSLFFFAVCHSAFELDLAFELWHLGFDTWALKPRLWH